MSALPLINDSDAIKALLETIQASAEWQKVANPESPLPSFGGTPVAENTTQATIPAETSSTLHGEEVTNSVQSPPSVEAAPSVASLLLQLQSSAPSSSSQDTPHRPPSGLYYDEATTPPPSPQAQYDLRQLTFQQALPHLARMVEDQSFIAAVKKMKQEQVELERKLWNERRNIQRSHADKVTLEMKKANITGGLTKYQAEAMADTFRKELERFDGQRVLPAWDNLLAKQQSSLESLGVPTMFTTTESGDRERQQRVAQVLAGMDL